MICINIIRIVRKYVLQLPVCYFIHINEFRQKGGYDVDFSRKHCASQCYRMNDHDFDDSAAPGDHRVVSHDRTLMARRHLLSPHHHRHDRKD
ncbi:hypothetical protein TNCV_1669821 [Trichonephila clavipes]|nr:hypothetical protein TNCV_1669821 [Trichonephila clavipes]